MFLLFIVILWRLILTYDIISASFWSDSGCLTLVILTKMYGKLLVSMQSCLSKIEVHRFIRKWQVSEGMVSFEHMQIICSRKRATLTLCWLICTFLVPQIQSACIIWEMSSYWSAEVMWCLDWLSWDPNKSDKSSQNPGNPDFPPFDVQPCTECSRAGESNTYHWKVN